MPRWKYKVELKRYLLDNLDDVEVKIIAQKLLPQLRIIIVKESTLKSHNPRKAVNYQLISDLEDIVSNLEWIIESIDKKESTEDCSFNTWAEALESELNMLGKLGSKVTKYEQVFSDNEHFLRVI
ncbi:hypothetical protein [Priestia megaterium]|uniref:hypothetical protein n=1 Tax=Priestia megaterium TaxID=1404 RepID=UPI002877A908|nr:hypothetical protein [Priestia megaterium]